MATDREPPPRRAWFRVIESYGWAGSLRLIRDVVLTRIFTPSARIIRRPVYIRGRRHIDLGQGLTVGVGLRIDAFPGDPAAGVLIELGSGIQMNDYVHLAAIERISIGNDTLIASRVFISDHNHGDPGVGGDTNGTDTRPADRPLASRPVTIGARVWIGEGVIVLPGVTIGDGAIVGGGAVVTRDVAPGCIVVGNPARTIKRYDHPTKLWQPV